MFSTELDKLLLLHIADLDEGVQRFEILQEKVADAIDDVFNNWLSQKDGWYPDSGKWRSNWDAAIAPGKWVPEGNWNAWFGLDYGAGDDGEAGPGKDYFWLTRLCREGRGQIGLRFCQEEFGLAPWKRFLKEKASSFSDTRFILDDKPSLFLPIRIDKEALASGAEEEDFSAALSPLTEAFDYIHGIVDRFEDLLAEMRKLQPTPS